MKNIFLIIVIAVISSLTTFAQQRTILFENDTLKIINDLYLNQSYTDISGYKSTHTCFFYVVSTRNKSDTLFRVLETPISKTYFNGSLFTLLTKGLHGEFTYALYELQQGKWKPVVYIPTLSVKKTLHCEVQQPSMYVFNVNWYLFDKPHKSYEHQVDISRRILIRYVIEDGKLIKDTELPFLDYSKHNKN